MDDRHSFEDAEGAFESGDYATAGNIWEKMVDNPDALFNAGNAFREARDFGRSKANFELAIALNVPEAYLNLAYLLEDQGDSEKAGLLIEEGARIGDPGAAVELARRIVDVDPGRAFALASAHVDNALVREYAEEILSQIAGAGSSSN